ncbi:hypothetical protein NQ314_003932 [Rhamnusium bicolor]|uniref:Macro domain-containing protein n=1 Tax=Rhamnusium bicolor TaxID=1586634 RepID=A0AAV8ZNK4_9CUCU|nr:hypothetical protein NQ314_003932 [Rhamnusium bicolor]
MTEGNLFEAPAEFSLVHCVSTDFIMSEGIALEFRKRYRSTDVLKGQGKQLGEVATLHLPDENIHLVTKSKFYHKPSYQILWQSLWYLKEYCVNHHDQFLAMPKIGC